MELMGDLGSAIADIDLAIDGLNQLGETEVASGLKELIDKVKEDFKNPDADMVFTLTERIILICSLLLGLSTAI